ncbi:MAG: hypothetical protein AAFP18_08745 [Bacteroidota bacterium]
MPHVLLALVLLLALPAQAQDLPSAAVTQVLLDALKVDDGTGRFSLPRFTIAFPQGDRAKAIVRNADGDIVFERGYKGQRDGTRTARIFRKDSGGGGRFGLPTARRTSEEPVFEESGAYTLDIEHGGEVITRFPFRVVRITSSDPYADTPPRFAVDGLWMTHGFVDYEDDATGRQPHLQWNYYDQLMDADRERLVFEQVRYELRRDGRLIGRTVTDSGVSSDGLTIATQTFEAVERPNSSHAESRIHRGDMTDGTYEIRRVVKADDFNGGNFRETITFDVRGGQFVPVGDQVRAGTEATAFLEGLNRAFFYPISSTR